MVAENEKGGRPNSAWSASFDERQGCKPVSVFKSAIYLRNLPPGIRRAALDCRYIWSCRLRDRTRKTSLPSVVGSYPAFSPLQAYPAGAGQFLRFFSVTASMRLLPSGLSPAECPSLSGLSSPAPRPAHDVSARYPGAADRPASLLSRMQM